VAAGVTTLVAIVWSVPNYFAGVPSWYNLFFATFGTLALVWYVETGCRKWLFVAGVFGGMSLLAKITGVYYIAAAVLFLTFSEQIVNKEAGKNVYPWSGLFILVKIVGTCLFVTALMALLHWRPNLMEICYFLIPSVSICSVLLYDEWQREKRPLLIRIKSLSALLWPFFIGVLIPLAVFISIYIAKDSLFDLYKGVFILPHKRFDFASRDFPPALTAIASLPYAAICLLPPSRFSTKTDKILAVILIVVLVVSLYLSSVVIVYSIVWQSVRFLGVVAVVAGSRIVLRSHLRTSADVKQRQMLFLVTSVTALISLVQFPFASPIYFCYTAPFVCLVLLGVFSSQGSVAKGWHFIIAVFYFIFALVWTNTGYIAAAIGSNGYPASERLDIPRGKLRVTAYDQQVYSEVVKLVQKYSNSKYIYAAPDCPEVYFLSGMHNPTRNLFDFFADSAETGDSLRRLFKEKKINVVVINHKPEFSGILKQQSAIMLQQKFPHSMDIGRFSVRWKE
jgi:hypothetical protein